MNIKNTEELKIGDEVFFDGRLGKIVNMEGNPAILYCVRMFNGDTHWTSKDNLKKMKLVHKYHNYKTLEDWGVLDTPMWPKRFYVGKIYLENSTIDISHNGSFFASLKEAEDSFLELIKDMP